MIYGLIPIGGKGTRLSLPFSKEMLPQKNYGYFNPIANHLVEKMLLAGAEKVIFIHGEFIKEDVSNYFSDEKFIHSTQIKTGFSKVLTDILQIIINLKDSDQIFFGLPDSIFDGNPFVEMTDISGICAGIFQTYESTKVDRLNLDATRFQVKSIKNETNQDWFWGALKFDGKNLKEIAHKGQTEKYAEIGEIINEHIFSLVRGHRYVDIGTWENYNKYISDMEKYSYSEIEKKYDASDVSESEFIDLMQLEKFNAYESINSTDYYFTSQNKNLEFIRYREKAENSSHPPDITVKSHGKNSINRFELEVPLALQVSSTSVIQILKLLGTDYQFKVKKKCHIYTLDEAVVVLYELEGYGKNLKFIEIELTTANYGVMLSIERRLSKLKGFDHTNVVNSSKFKIISKIIDSQSTIQKVLQ